MDRKIRKEAALERMEEENMGQINEAEVKDAEALKELDREIREKDKLERKKKKREINNNLARLFNQIKF